LASNCFFRKISGTFIIIVSNVIGLITGPHCSAQFLIVCSRSQEKLCRDVKAACQKCYCCHRYRKSIQYCMYYQSMNKNNGLIFSTFLKTPILCHFHSIFQDCKIFLSGFLSYIKPRIWLPGTREINVFQVGMNARLNLTYFLAKNVGLTTHIPTHSAFPAPKPIMYYERPNYCDLGNSKLYII
jgi:hypothetical protein